MRRAVEALATCAARRLDRRQPLPAARLSGARDRQGDRDCRRDLRGVDPRQDRARRDAGRARPQLSRCTASRSTRATRRRSIWRRWRGTGRARRIGARSPRSRRPDSPSDGAVGVAQAPGSASVRRFRHRRRLARQRQQGGRARRPRARRARRLGRVRRRLARRLPSGDGSGAPRRSAVAAARQPASARCCADCVVRFGLELDARELAALNRVWHRLSAWRDVRAGLRRLKRGCIDRHLVQRQHGIAGRAVEAASLPWDCILSAELFRHYKPDPEVYLRRRRAARARPCPRSCWSPRTRTIWRRRGAAACRPRMCTVRWNSVPDTAHGGPDRRSTLQCRRFRGSRRSARVVGGRGMLCLTPRRRSIVRRREPHAKQETRIDSLCTARPERFGRRRRRRRRQGRARR